MERGFILSKHYCNVESSELLRHRKICPQQHCSLGVVEKLLYPAVHRTLDPLSYLGETNPLLQANSFFHPVLKVMMMQE